MWKIALILIATLVVVPIATFYFDDPLTELQSTVLFTLLWVYGIAATIAFLVGWITKNYSQVDKLWSTIPIAYVWISVFYSSFEPRIVLMAVVVTIWAIRLTYNFARRGGYSWKIWEGEEDYRWEILQAKPGFEKKWKWILFNLLFVCGYQMALILMMTLPIVKSIGSDVPLGILDYLTAGGLLLFVAIELVADQQQYNYQQEKYRRKNNNEPLGDYYEVGFTHTGLWAWMRHPNYMGEQAIWIVFYLFSVISTGHIVNWSIAGCLLLLVLFKGSSDFSEEISAGKYPLYKKYQKEVGRFLPFKGKFKSKLSPKFSKQSLKY